MMMSATKVKVASQTICQTTGMSVNPIAPVAKAKKAPTHGGPANAEAARLPDDEHQSGDEDREGEH